VKDLTTARLGEIWSLLDPADDTGYRSFPLEMEPGVDVRVALDVHGVRHLLVEKPGEQSFAASDGWSLSVKDATLRFGKTLRSYLSLACADPGLHPEFDDLIVDVLTLPHAPGLLAGSVHGSVDRWRRLMRSAATRQMSRERLFGLFAELSVLLQVLKRDPSAIAAWTGPQGSSHDFELKRGCLEVKALGLAGDTVRIHGVDQLDTHDGRPLVLVAMSVVEGDDGLTIRELVDDINAVVGDTAAFDAALARAGWGASGVQNPERLGIADSFRFAIESGAAGLRPDQFIDGALRGVDRLDYDLQIAELLDRVISKSLNDVLLEMMG
jgi:hypothetical protein